MRLEFSDIRGKDTGKTGFVLGLGPSLRKHLSMLETLHNDKDHYKIVSCNNMDILTSINFDYWVLAQPADHGNPLCITNAYHRYNSKNALLLYTDCLDLTPRHIVAEKLTCNYIGYDQRHFNGEPCDWGAGPGGRHICCDGIIPGRLNIQQYLQSITGYHECYGCGDTVAVHMLAVAIIAGLNPIYITGVDLDYTQGYVNNNFAIADVRIRMGMTSMNQCPQMVDRVLRDLDIIRRMALNIGVKIYDLDGTGKLASVFPHKKPNSM